MHVAKVFQLNHSRLSYIAWSVSHLNLAMVPYFRIVEKLCAMLSCQHLHCLLDVGKMLITLIYIIFPFIQKAADCRETHKYFISQLLVVKSILHCSLLKSFPLIYDYFPHRGWQFIGGCWKYMTIQFCEIFSVIYKFITRQSFSLQENLSDVTEKASKWHIIEIKNFRQISCGYRYYIDSAKKWLERILKRHLKQYFNESE